MAIDSALQSRVNSLLDPFPEGDRRDTTFSPFRPEHAELVAGLAEQLAATATADGLGAALAQAEGGMEGALPGAVKQAVAELVTHHPEARGRVSAPSVEATPLGAEDAAALGAPADSVIPVPNPETLPADERVLDWYREDPLANDHHGHWHKVYPMRGQNGKTQPRQGELFFYMHQQMLARYATERKIAGLPPLVPFEPIDSGGQPSYTAPIPEGYGLPRYTARGSGKQLHDIPAVPNAHGAVPVKAMADEHAVLMAALAARKIRVAGGGTVPLTESFFGAAVEPSTPRAADDSGALQFVQSAFPWFHGLGHVLCSEVNPNEPDDRYLGPMAYFETAISDPFFYRWHGHIDDLYAGFQKGAGANAYEQFAADVEFPNADGEPDIALVLSRRIPGSDTPGFDFATWAPQAFEPHTPATDRLVTRFTPMRAEVTAPGGATHTLVDHADLLNHEPFTVVLRLRNTRPDKQDVTVRLFLAHADMAGDRRRWIELDKFKATLAPGDNVIAQPDARSSVIKRKGVTAPGAEPLHSGVSPWCDCGWPYSLLIPSGASDPDGTKFHLMAAVTNWTQDGANDAETCTSMSFCGSEQFYPDKRNMGYPFDREFPAAGVLATIAAQPTMTVRDLTIVCETPRPT